MKLKKILAVVTAAALTAALCLPVAAEESATAGEATRRAALDLLGMTQQKYMDVPQAESKMREITENLQEPEVTVSSEMMTAALAFFDRMENDQNPGTKKTDASKEGVSLSYRCEADDSMSVNDVSLDEESGEVVLDATAAESEYGFAVTVDLPADTRVTTYKITMKGENAQQIDATVPVKSYLDKDNTTHKYVTFWVPHFTTYVLTSFSTNTAAETTTTTTTSSATAASGDSVQYYTCQACGYHNWTATEEGYRCDNCGYIESQKQLAGYGNVKGVYSPKTGTENPIKATGSDMNRTVFVVVALAVAAACGMGVASKKSRKSE